MLSQETYQFNYHWTGCKNQPTILFLHGFMGNYQDFNHVIASLSENFSCLAVDLPGHGKTLVKGGEECYAMPQTAQALIHLLDALEIETCLLAGYSMGGRLALYMMLYFSSRFEGGILESASPGLKTESERSHRFQADLQLAKTLEMGNFPEFLRNWYNQPLFKSLKNHPDFDKLLQNRLTNHPQELAKSLRNLGTGNQPSLWETLKLNSLPLLLLAGETDGKLIGINTEIARLCPNSHLEIIPKTGHNIHWENPAEYIKIVRDFCVRSPTNP